MKAKPVALFWNLSCFVCQEISTLIKIWCLLHHRSPELSRQICRSCTVPAPPPQPGRLSGCVRSEGEAGRSNSARKVELPGANAFCIDTSILQTDGYQHFNMLADKVTSTWPRWVPSICIVLHCWGFLLVLDCSACQLLPEGVTLLLVLVWYYLRISDFLEALLTCTQSTSLKHKRSRSCAKHGFCSPDSSTYHHCSSVAILTLINNLNMKDTNLYCPAPNLEPTYQEEINNLNRNLYCRSIFKLNRCLNERHAAPFAHRAPLHIFACIVLHCQVFSFVFNFFELPKCH